MRLVTLRTPALAALVIVAVLGLLAAACGSNPNENVQANEYFRPASEQQEQVAAQAQQEESETQQGEAQTQAQQQAQTQAQAAQEQAEASEQAEGQTEAETEAEAQSEQTQDEESQADAPSEPGIETADDIIRRYTNPSYGYSIQLVCPPFCDASSNGIDRVTFLSETGRALIGINAVLDTDQDPEALLRETLNLPENVQILSREAAMMITGEAAERIVWEEDRRATGGFLVRWQAYVTVVDGIALIVRAGAVADDYESMEPSFERALSTFILPLEVEAKPGVYDRFGFLVRYSTDDFAQEFGQPTINPPNEDAGIFVLQTETALRAVLIWQALGQAFYDGDTALERTLNESLGMSGLFDLRDGELIDGQPSRTGLMQTQIGEGTVQVRSYAWYCVEGGREFVLHVLDPEDPEAIALPLLDSFRCNAEAAEDTEATEAEGE